VALDRIPKGATGKVQRIGLAEKLADRLRVAYLAPRTVLETVVAAVYSEVLGVERAGALDNFFLLGGDSLRATQVVSRIQAVLPVSLPLATVFQKPSVAELAEAVSSMLEPPDRQRLEEMLATSGAGVFDGSPGHGHEPGPLGGVAPIPRGRRARGG
jgi:acyl carrier protein